MTALPDNRLRRRLADVLDAAPDSWRPLIDAWRRSAEGQGIERFIAARQAAGAVIYPDCVLRALDLTPFDRVRVVILGQDPYHGPGQAEGLAFSVPPGQKLPPSLRNIVQELPPGAVAQGSLAGWARQGVLLLNTVLTVEQGLPASHAKQGWESLTDRIVAALAAQADSKVFMLWGAHAQAKVGLIRATGPHHLLLTSNHPSPLSASRGPLPFIGNGHFLAANRFLTARAGGAAVDWGLPA